MAAARFVVADVVFTQSGSANYLSGKMKYRSDQSVPKSKLCFIKNEQLITVKLYLKTVVMITALIFFK